MGTKVMPFLFILPVLILTIALVAAGSAEGAAVVIDETTLEYSPSEPYHSNVVNISVEIMMIDAEPIENGVVLKISMCTATSCELPTTIVMENVAGSDVWEVTAGPFPEEDLNGDPYEYFHFHFEVTADPTDSTPGQVTGSSAEMTVYFKEAPQTDDDDTDDSPFPGAIPLLAAILTSSAVLLPRKR